MRTLLLTMLALLFTSPALAQNGGAVRDMSQFTQWHETLGEQTWIHQMRLTEGPEGNRDQSNAHFDDTCIEDPNGAVIRYQFRWTLLGGAGDEAWGVFNNFRSFCIYWPPSPWNPDATGEGVVGGGDYAPFGAAWAECGHGYPDAPHPEDCP